VRLIGMMVIVWGDCLGKVGWMKLVDYLIDD